MKKQALAFFTMFSLILMLSIYYITLPSETKTTKKEVSVISELNKTSDKNKQQETEKNNDAISDPNTSEEEKNEAIIKNETLKEQAKQQEQFSKLVSDLGYENHIEIKDKTIYVNIMNQEQDNEIASKVMKSIFKEVGNNFFIEVSFNSK